MFTFSVFFHFPEGNSIIKNFFKIQECSGKCSWCYAILFHLYGQLLWVVHSNTKLYARYENIFTVHIKPKSVTMHSSSNIHFTCQKNTVVLKVMLQRILSNADKWSSMHSPCVSTPNNAWPMHTMHSLCISMHDKCLENGPKPYISLCIAHSFAMPSWMPGKWP